MRRTILIFLAAAFSGSTLAQQGKELLVYAVKGKATAVYQNISFPLKIGKVLQPGTVITTEKDASLTLLCQQGKPISVSQAGQFPLSKWKDSCSTGTAHTVSGNYFRYIWQQLYANSPEHKEEKRRQNNLAVSRGESQGTVPAKSQRGIQFKPGMDTVYDDGSSFPLSWTAPVNTGPYFFTLLDANGKKAVYRDTVRSPFIAIDSFRHLLKEGNTYRWTVGARGMKTSRSRILRVVGPEKGRRLLEQCLLPTVFEEEPAAQCLRVAYTLEKNHYLGAALSWYSQAAEKGGEETFFQEQLTRFRNDYWIR